MFSKRRREKNKKLITIDITWESISNSRIDTIITYWMVTKEKDMSHIMLDTKAKRVRSARMFMLTEFLHAYFISQFTVLG